MAAPRRWILAMAATVMMAGCSNSPDDAPPASAAPSSSSPASARPATTAASAFCLDLSTFQVGVVVYRADVGAAIRGRALDFEDLRQRATMISLMGKEMRSSAPSDIAEEFRAVLNAVDTSASRLKPSSKVRDVVDPLFSKDINPAFDAVDRYECGAAGAGSTPD